MSEAQQSVSVTETSPAIDQMGTINSSPEAPATIDSEINKEIDIGNTEDEDNKIEQPPSPDPLLKEL
tara:strand:+ start:149 stop:349 length:201 start_codon:yes stop_codon:yes gene_type:complete